MMPSSHLELMRGSPSMKPDDPMNHSNGDSKMKKTDRLYVELDLASIVGAKENLRDTAPWLSKRGYAIFQPSDTQQRPLASLALSEDAQDKAEHVRLIEQNETSVKELADNMTTNG